MDTSAPRCLPTRGAVPRDSNRDRSVIVMALIHVAWQLSYEEVVDYFRAHADAASAAGFAPGQVISVGQYWERRRALGILPFWFFFVGMVWQLIHLAVIQGTCDYRCHDPTHVVSRRPRGGLEFSQALEGLGVGLKSIRWCAGGRNCPLCF